MTNDKILLDHGSGGKISHSMFSELILPLFDNVQIFNNLGSYMLSIGSQGTAAGEFWMPSGLFIDPDDTLYVCDTYNKRIQLFQILTDPQHRKTAEPLLRNTTS